MMDVADVWLLMSVISLFRYGLTRWHAFSSSEVRKIFFLMHWWSQDEIGAFRVLFDSTFLDPVTYDKIKNNGCVTMVTYPHAVSNISIPTMLQVIRLEGPEDPHLRNSRFGGHVNTSGPDPLGFDWEGLAASRGTVGGHRGPPPLNSLKIDSPNVECICIDCLLSEDK